MPLYLRVSPGQMKSQNLYSSGHSHLQNNASNIPLVADHFTCVRVGVFPSIRDLKEVAGSIPSCLVCLPMRTICTHQMRALT